MEKKIEAINSKLNQAIGRLTVHFKDPELGKVHMFLLEIASDFDELVNELLEKGVIES